MEQEFFDQFFRSAPADVDVPAIRREWQALHPPYRLDERRLPLPVWGRRGFTETGEQAWVALRRHVPAINLDRAFCIYVHIPFCADRCEFCDCYSFPLRRGRDRHVTAYLDCLTREVQLWHRLGTLAERPVSTVHFGGGTPTFLDIGAFRRLVDVLRDSFNTGPETEWALESTSSELTGEMSDALAAMGFTRLHVGVQTLQDPVREAIHRRETATVVQEKIERAVAKGWIVSVDLILGLPGQTLAGVLTDVAALEAVGVDGFSLYELQHSSRNRRFIEAYGLADHNRLPVYLSMQAAAHRLSSLGYEKTLFNHFAREEDTNLYFTFPERGEDCLALGTIADGVFSDFHYRHPAYKPYTRGVSRVFPGLEGGLRRSPRENQLHRLEVALLSTRIPYERFAEVLGEESARALFQRWHAAALVEETGRPGHLRLTGNGSWLVAQMMADLGHDV
ncbi:MAG: radical SAM protein [Anaerolineae bacterium]|jgi:coproporphyrinogen III oxidase-like Fe-S oxidoreductase